MVSEYDLTVSATDGAFVSTARVTISILDANDNAPTCDQVRNLLTLSSDLYFFSCIFSSIQNNQFVYIHLPHWKVFIVQV